jgi:hypothetical protein
MCAGRKASNLFPIKEPDFSTDSHEYNPLDGKVAAALPGNNQTNPSPVRQEIEKL